MSTSHDRDDREAGGRREANAAETREAILAAAEALLEEGEEPTMRSVAARARIGERTIYRYFDSHDVLAEALHARLGPRLGVPLPAHADQLPDYIRDLFQVFEQNTGLVAAIVHAPQRFGTHQRRKRNLADLEKLLDAAHPHAPAAERAAAAACLRTVVSGSGWHYLRVSSGLPNARVIEDARWMVRTVRDRLRAASKPT